MYIYIYIYILFIKSVHLGEQNGGLLIMLRTFVIHYYKKQKL
jgi:hypothetical protein